MRNNVAAVIANYLITIERDGMNKLISVLVMILLPFVSYAGQTSCSQFFVGGSAPEYTNQKVAVKTRELCNLEYAVGYSGVTKTALWSAELLTKQALDNSKGLPRTNDFRPDIRIPANERAELSSFARSGYDRGHLTPNSDSGGVAGMEGRSQTYLLSNIIAQDSENNRGIWSEIEGTTRQVAKKFGEIFVITGPIFQGDKVFSIKGGVLVPTGIYKCIYEPKRDQGGCFVVNNAPGREYNVSSISAVEKTIGINLFPLVSASVKANSMIMPEPKAHNKRR